ncbi:hypothetical protein DRP77_07415 [Candidatus Poribacteria bacterium]|nr:MAG: hypothetical protein DRP77_07415 [Candidatus Poribacteria bacterium]
MWEQASRRGMMRKTGSSWVNPAVLRWARKRLGLSPEDVEQISESLRSQLYAPVKAEEILRWERGEEEPDLEHLETLAEIYVCPLGYFFLPHPPQEHLPLSMRGLSPEKEGRLSPLSHRALRQFLELAEWTASLIERSNFEWKVSVEPIDPSSIEDIDILVQRERERLGFHPEVRGEWTDADEAFRWWRRRIESLGIFCFELKLEGGDVRGASVWVNSRYPFILVNRQDIEAATGRIFTLLHEYAHLLTSREGVACDFHDHGTERNPEILANRFAARMLLSHEELKCRLRELGMESYRARWGDKLLDEVRKPFFVSRDVIAIMLQEMGLAPPNFYRVKRMQWERRKIWKKGRGRPTRKEQALRKLGFSLTYLLSEARGSIPPAELADVLGMKVERIDEFFEWLRLELSSKR